MTRARNIRSLLYAATALTVLAGPASAQLLSGNGNGINIPGITLPGKSGSATPRQGVTTSVEQALVDPGVAVQTEYSPLGDNLGNHTAVRDMNLSGFDLLMDGGDIDAGGGRVLELQTVPTDPTEASSKFYVDSLRSDLTESITTIEGDVQTLFDRRIDTPANQGLQGGGALTSDLTLTVDNTVVRTSRDQLIAGAKTFTGSVLLNGNRLLAVGTPVDGTDGVNKAYVDQLGEVLGGEIDQLDETFRSRRINTGTGLLGGGDLSADRTLTFDTSWGDARYALRARSLTAGDGLIGGGDLSADRTFTVDASVVRTSGSQIIGGNKTFTGLLAFSNQRLTSVGTPTVASDAATKGYVDGIRSQLDTDIDTLTARRINTGTGLLGGGDLSADRTLTFDIQWGDLRYALAARDLSAGDGLSGGGDLTTDRSFSVDGTVVRTSGTQVIAGAKTFRQAGGTLFDRATGQDGVTLMGRAGGTSGYSVTISPTVLTANRTLTLADGATSLVPGTMVPDARVLTAGDGLSGGGTLSADRSFAVDGTVVRTSGAQSIGGAKTFTSSANFSNLRVLGVATPTQATDGVNKSYVDGLLSQVDSDIATLAGRRINTGTGLLGGGDLSADRTLTFDTTWGDARYALAARTLTAGDGLTGGGTLAANRSFAVDSTVARTSRTLTAGDGLSGGGDLSANRSFAVDGTVVRTSGNQVIAGTKTFRQSSGILFDRATGQDGITLMGRAGGTSGYSVTITPTVLTANRTLTLADGATRLVPGTMVPDARVLTAGDGLSGGGTLSADRSFAVDGTVVRTSGTQSIGGAKTFTSSVNFSNLRVLGVATPTQATDGVNKSYVDGLFANAGSTYDAGTGLVLTGTTFSLDPNQQRRATTSTALGVLAYNGDTAASAQFYGGTTNPSSTNVAHRVNFQGTIYATKFYAQQYFYFSDETLKENIEQLEASEGMGLIRQIRPVRYDWRQTGREALGVIAQETERVLPNLVDTDPNGIKSVDYIQLISPLIAAVQDLDQRVSELEKTLGERP